MKARLITTGIVLLLIAAQARTREVQVQSAESGANPNVYKAGSAPFRVQIIEHLVLDDAKRKKALQLRINYPDGSGPFPVIVFSHGAWGSKENYSVLTEFWASHGYVTIQPTHSDSLKLGTRFGDPNTFRDWQSRPADVSFIIDSLSEIEKRNPLLKAKMDGNRIGVGGHSFGANTAMLIGGAKAFINPGRQERSFEDKRVTVILVMSGQGPGEMLTERSWEGFTKPMLVMTGSEDGPTRMGQPAESRKKPYELSPPGDKYLMWVEGLDHGFGGISGARFSRRNKVSADHVQYTKVATLAFWDAYLKKSKEAHAYLGSGKLSELSKGAIELRHK